MLNYGNANLTVYTILKDIRGENFLKEVAMMLIEKLKRKRRNQKFKTMINLQGEHSFVGKGFQVIGGRYITVGENFSAEKNLYLQAWYKYNGVLTGLTPSIIIGTNVSMMSNCHLSAINKIEIGDGTLLGDNVFITDNYHGSSTKEEMDIPPLQRKLYSKGPVIVGKNVWLGRNVSIMSGVNIGDGAVIGANAVVTHDIPAHCIAAGVPAKVIRVVK